MKKSTSILLITALLILFLTPVIQAADNGEEYIYTSTDGKTIYYYLDEDNMPYHYNNGAREYLLLPLEHLKVTDEQLINELNQSKNIRDSKAVLSYSLKQNSPNVVSNVYTQFMTFEANNSIQTQQLVKYLSHTGVHVRTANLGKLHWYTGKTVTINFYYELNAYSTWYCLTRTNIDATSTDGEVFATQSGMVQNIYVKMEKYSNNVVWFDLKIWSEYYTDPSGII